MTDEQLIYRRWLLRGGLICYVTTCKFESIITRITDFIIYFIYISIAVLPKWLPVWIQNKFTGFCSLILVQDKKTNNWVYMRNSDIICQPAKEIKKIPVYVWWTAIVNAVNYNDIIPWINTYNACSGRYTNALYNLKHTNIESFSKTIEDNRKEDTYLIKGFRYIINGCLGDLGVNTYSTLVEATVEGKMPAWMQAQNTGANVSRLMMETLGLTDMDIISSEFINSKLANLAQRVTRKDIRRNEQMPKRLYNTKNGKSIETFECVQEYSTLSYTWGRWALETKPTITKDGIPWKIMRNSKVTLEDIKTILDKIAIIAGTHMVWIDQYCINQEYEQEKQEEIARQHYIFGNAKRSFIWLSETSSQDIIYLMEHWKTLGVKSTKWAIDAHHITQKISQDKWFSSLWATQETAICPESIILLQDGSVVLVDSYTNIDAKFDKIDNKSFMRITFLKMVMESLLVASKAILSIVRYTILYRIRVLKYDLNNELDTLDNIVNNVDLLLGKTDITSFLDDKLGYLGLQSLGWKRSGISKDYIHGIKNGLLIDIETPYICNDLEILIEEFLGKLYSKMGASLMSYICKGNPRNTICWLPQPGSILLPNVIIGITTEGGILKSDVKMNITFNDAFEMNIENAQIYLKTDLEKISEQSEIHIEDDACNIENIALMLLSILESKQTQNAVLLTMVITRSEDESKFRRKGMASYKLNKYNIPTASTEAITLI